jgi:LacI family transcriptional regulator/LacI family repressor for deo operon, udp, cdd, tsx, nupC, and nupG
VTKTIRDVARRAGVSAGTVSRVMAGFLGVAAATRQRVLHAVEELGYRPNPAAQRLSSGKTLTVAITVPFFTLPSVAARLSGAMNLLADTPYDVIVHNIQVPARRAACFQQIPHRRRADGLLIISIPPLCDSEVDSLSRADVPIVMIDADHEHLTSLCRVVVDDEAGGRLAAEHLLGLGHRRIGFLGDQADNPFHFTSTRDRLRGYRQALEAAGRAPRDEDCLQGEHSRADARRLARSMLSAPDRPTAIFAASDTQAAGVLEAARDLGLRVPEQLSVIGYDDIELAEIVGLTTIRQPLFRSGQRGMQLLLDALRGHPHPPAREVLPVELVQRGTTAPPP